MFLPLNRQYIRYRLIGVQVLVFLILLLLYSFVQEVGVLIIYYVPKESISQICEC